MVILLSPCLKPIFEICDFHLFDRKLQDVKERLNQLKDLVQYYQTGSEFIHGEPDGAAETTTATTQTPAAEDPEEMLSSLPLFPDYDDQQRMQKARHPVTTKAKADQHGGRSSQSPRQSSVPPPRPALPPMLLQATEVPPAQADMSETMSQISSTLGDDPEVQEKVR